MNVDDYRICKISAQLQSTSETSRISYENHSGEYLVRVFFVKHPGTWLTIEQIERFLEQKRKKMTRGSLYNVLSNLKNLNFIESRRSSFAEYRLIEIKGEIHPVGGSSRGVRIVRFDFFDYLETLRWEDVCRVHDIRLWAPVGSCDFASGDGWDWRDHQGKFIRRELVGRLRFTLEVYAKARVLVVSIGCANSPVSVSFKGLTHLYSVVCEVRGSFLNSVSVPQVGDWVVKQWHYGRDSKSSISGFSFDVTFYDWFGSFCRVYSRHNGRVRLERVESPNVRFSRLLSGQTWERRRLS